MAMAIIVLLLMASFAYTTNGCNTRLTSTSGTFNSPNYPSDYPDSSDCLYDIEVIAGWRIELQIQDFSLEGASSCGFDVFEVYDGSTTSSPKIASLCGEGQSGGKIQSSGNRLLVRFKSDGSVTKRGFLASYSSSSNPACNIILPTDRGVIQSLNYPSDYQNYENCLYRLNVTQGRIKLHINDFSLENSGTCGYDKLEVVDGSGATLAALCGDSHNGKEIISQQSSMLIRFKTDGSVTSRGFSISHSVATNGLNLGGCGLSDVVPSNTGSAYVVAGSESVHGSWPWQVALYDNSNFKCGGSLIDSTWVLTAAHCLTHNSVSSLTIEAGITNRNSKESSLQTLEAESFIKHPNFNSTSLANDIALIKLKRPIQLTRYVYTVCLPYMNEELSSGVSGFITGWGKTNGASSTFSSTLQQAEINVIDVNVCKGFNAHNAFKTTDDHYCLRNTGSSQSACLGDGGGSFVVQKQVSGRNVYLQHGISSFSHVNCNANGHPSVYVKVSRYIDWITGHVSAV